jgi:hypothetical protein
LGVKTTILMKKEKEKLESLENQLEGAADKKVVF